MSMQHGPRPVMVTPERRDETDPDFPVPDVIKCPECPGFAYLQQYFAGYGYDCGMCGARTPVAVPGQAPRLP